MIDDVAHMLEALLKSGFNEGTMGWDSRCYDVLPAVIDRFRTDDDDFELLMRRLRPLVRDTLDRCFLEAERNVIALEECRRNEEENARLARR